MKQYRSKEIYGDFFENEKKPLVVIINGSKPGLPYPIEENFLETLKNRYNVLLLAYFGIGELPHSLEMVPMEYFINSINYFKDKIGLNDDEIIVIGNSKGGEAALVLTNFLQSAITIACVASCYVFQGLPENDMDIVNNPKSSWTYNNRELPYIRFYTDNEIFKEAMENKFYNCHLKSLENNYNEDAVINVDDYKGRIFLISAEHDPYWPSKDMSNKIIENCRNKNKISHISLNLNGHRYLDFKESTHEILKYLDKNAPC